jgi:Flp pilus assembly protein TadB
MALYVTPALILAAVGIVLILGGGPAIGRKIVLFALRRQEGPAGEPGALAEQVRKRRGKGRKNFIAGNIASARVILEDTGRADRYERLTTLSLLAAAFGLALSLLLENPFLLPVLAVGFYLLPWQYVRLTGLFAGQSLTEELEMTLSVITNSYLRTENIIQSVEENVPAMTPPVSVPFEKFLAETNLVSSDVKTAILRMKGRLKNVIYDEWLDALAACQDDRGLKTQLLPIVEKFSDVRRITAELHQIIAEPVKEFGVMVAMTFGGVFILRMMNREWYDTLMHTLPGKITLAVIALVVFLSAARVIDASRPPEYKR